MSVDDSFVDIASKAEIVGVRDQVFQASILNRAREQAYIKRWTA